MHDLEAEQSVSRVASSAEEWLIVIRSTLLASLVFAVGCLVPLALRLRDGGPLPASLVSDILFIALSIACAWWLTGGGRLARFGFTFGTFR